MHILVTAGPTREYLDDVRFISNASSGRMGYAIAAAAVRRGWHVSLVSGPVAFPQPAGAWVRSVTSAQQMLDACLELLPQVDGVIAVAAVADYRPRERLAGKMHRDSQSLHVELVPNADILAEIGRRKMRQWSVGFAVESQDLLERGRSKLQKKNCDAMVLNHTQAMESEQTAIQILDHAGRAALQFSGDKKLAAERIVEWIAEHLCRPVAVRS